ncbi:MAG: outer rane beta-barrel protein [Daejeonella sp.]|nr:outer rane beta-barrel protein [Daejeonella sp.]
MRKLILLVTCFLATQISFAQTWELGASAGASGYMGDLNPVKFYKFTDVAYGAHVKRNFDGRWSLKLNLLQSKVRAADSNSVNIYQQSRNLSFYSPVTEASILIEFNFFKYFAGNLPENGNHRISPYLFTGIGGIRFNPKTVYQGEEVILAPLKTENISYTKNSIVVPFGAGIKYNVRGNWNLSGEIGYRTVFNDYLDDVSFKYPGTNAFDNPLSAALSDRSGEKNGITLGISGVQRGDLRKRDTYMFAGIGLSYTFVSTKCPMF